MIRRLAAAVAAAFVLALTVPAMSASAAEEQPMPPASCLFPPQVVLPSETLAGAIDRGPKDPTSSSYSQLGFAGLRLPTFEAKSCIKGVPIGGRPGDDRNTTIGNATIGGMAVIGAIATESPRIVMDRDGLWSVVRSMLAPLPVAFDATTIILFLTIGSTVTATFLAWRASLTEEWRATRIATHRAAIIFCFAVLCMAWTGIVATTQMKAVGATMQATQMVATGNAGTADTVIGDAIHDGIIAPSQAYALLGPDKAAVDKYAWRLRAASTVSRREEAKLWQETANGNGGAYLTGLVERKNADYISVMTEMKRDDPRVYRRAAGLDTDGRASGGILGLLLVILGVLPEVAALAVIGGARALGEVTPYVFPLAAAVLMFPTMQRFAGLIGRKVITWTAAACVCCVAFVAWVIGPIRGIVANVEATMWERLIAMSILYGGIWFGWKMRDEIVAKLKISDDIQVLKDTVESAVDSVADRLGLGSATQAADSATAADSTDTAGTELDGSDDDTDTETTATGSAVATDEVQGEADEASSTPVPEPGAGVEDDGSTDDEDAVEAHDVAAAAGDTDNAPEGAAEGRGGDDSTDDELVSAPRGWRDMVRDHTTPTEGTLEETAQDEFEVFAATRSRHRDDEFDRMEADHLDGLNATPNDDMEPHHEEEAEAGSAAARTS